ncbi:MAG TPA: nuclear transport factor 2 family protein [Steroidobacteraceae bacterium]|nr:nuclear transport factor 2 family protein [Steroidobacteraceae bacterium]
MRAWTLVVPGRLGLVILGLLAGPAFAASTEDTIRQLEQQQVHAAVAGDATTLGLLFAQDFRIVEPNGAIASREELMKLLTGGAHPYRSGSYETQLVRDLGQVVVTVGLEEVVPDQGPQAGQVVHRRVMQVWKRDHGRWKLTLRDAMVVAQHPGG